jgi:cell division septum initiation protein DivIVA
MGQLPLDAKVEPQSDPHQELRAMIEVLEADVAHLTSALATQASLMRKASAFISLLFDGIEELQQHVSALEQRYESGGKRVAGRTVRRRRVPTP